MIELCNRMISTSYMHMQPVIWYKVIYFVSPAGFCPEFGC